MVRDEAGRVYEPSLEAFAMVRGSVFVLRSRENHRKGFSAWEGTWCKVLG